MYEQVYTEDIAILTRESKKCSNQRVLNDLYRVRLSRRCMIWLLLHPLTSLPSASCLSFSVFLCVAGWAYLSERGRGWGGSKITRRPESLVLFELVNTLEFKKSLIAVLYILYRISRKNEMQRRHIVLNRCLYITTRKLFFAGVCHRMC